MEDCASNCLINRNCFARVKDKHRHIVAKLSEGKVHVYKGSVKMVINCGFPNVGLFVSLLIIIIIIMVIFKCYFS